MCLNPVNEEFDRAYANVGLLASDVWSYQNEEVDYKKANLYLWIRFNETEKRLIEDDSSDDLSTFSETTYTVQDVIPFSRLATYNNFEYNEAREKIYVVDDEPPQYNQNSYLFNQNDLEVWMLPEVEKEFKRYTKGSQSGWCMLSPRYPSGRELVSIERITNTSPQKWLSETQWPNRLLSHYAEKLYSLKLSTDPSLFRDDLEPSVYDPEEVEMKLLEYPCPRYLIETNIDHRLHEMINSPMIRNLWATPTYPYGSYSQTFGLNAEVPEFQPVTFSPKLKVEEEHFDPLSTTQTTNNLHHIFHGCTAQDSSFGTRQQHYISIFDMNYEAEVFPYSSSSNKYYVDPDIINMETNEVVQPNPALVHPSGLYFNLDLLKSNWRNQPGSGSTNIVHLSDSETNEVPEQQIEPFLLNGGQPLLKSQSTEKIIAFLEKWVTKMYNPRSVDFNQMSSSSSRINKIFQNVQEGYCLVQGPSPVLQQPAHRPLYSDVLMSETNPAATNSESKFDELEQEALEQYSGSDTLIPPPPLQVSENVIIDDKSTPRSLPEDVKPQTLPSPQLSEKSHETKKDELFTGHRSRESSTSRQSCVSENAREEIGYKLETCHSSVKAKWIKKKKKKADQKKKKNLKNNKKKQHVENNKKLVESEMILINKFLERSNTFINFFNLDDWKLIEDGLTVQVKSEFEKGLSIFKDCLECFMTLTVERERDRCEDSSYTKKRLDLLRQTVCLLGNLINNLVKYMFFFSKIRMTIPCDHRLYFDPEKLIRQRPIIASQLHANSLNENIFSCNKVGLLTTVPNGKYLLRLLDSVIQEERLTLSYKHEWKLPLMFETPVNKKSYEIQINFKEWRIYLAEAELEKEELNSNANRKLVKIVEDYPTWHSGQWRFIDGWKLDMSDSFFSFHWCNRFDVKILEQIATSARLFVMYDWILELIDAVVLNKHYSSCEVLWNRKNPNLVRSKMVFYRLLLQKERDWYFGDVRINQQACCHLYSGCENLCCVTWMLNYDTRNTYCGGSGSLARAHQSRGHQQVMVRSTRLRCRKEDTKNTKTRSKCKMNKDCSPKRKNIFNEIQGVSDKMNIPQEKSLCIIQ